MLLLQQKWFLFLLLDELSNAHRFYWWRYIVFIHLYVQHLSVLHVEGYFISLYALMLFLLMLSLLLYHTMTSVRCTNMRIYPNNIHAKCQHNMNMNSSVSRLNSKNNYTGTSNEQIYCLIKFFFTEPFFIKKCFILIFFCEQFCLKRESSAFDHCKIETKLSQKPNWPVTWFKNRNTFLLLFWFHHVLNAFKCSIVD